MSEVPAGDDDHRALAYIDRNFSDPIVNKLQVLAPGLYTDNFSRLDYFQDRSLVDLSRFRLVPDVDTDGSRFDINDQIDQILTIDETTQPLLLDYNGGSYVQQRRFWRPNVTGITVYGFGFLFNPPTGLHETHMNRGNPPRGGHARENGAFQDGAVIVQRGRNFAAMFTAFQSQCVPTMANGFPAPNAKPLSSLFELAFAGGTGFATDPISTQWHAIAPEGKPKASFGFSPHADTSLSLQPVGDAIDQTTSSVFFAIAFLNQIRSGPTREAIDRLMEKDLFSYGIVDSNTKLEIKKPDGSVGLVDFAYLAAHAPQPFAKEWSGGKGIHEHNKFVVTDFNLPTAKVFTGSSNLSPSGEKNNDDNLVLIEDQRVATAYAINALQLFDHLHFRSAMQAASTPTELILAKPTALSGKPAWFERYYVANSQQARDRLLFSH